MTGKLLYSTSCSVVLSLHLDTPSLCCFHFLWGNRQFSHLIMKLLARSSHLESDCSCLSRRILMVWFPKCAGGNNCDNLMTRNDLDSVSKWGQSHRVPLAQIHFAAATDGFLPCSEWGRNYFTWFRIPGMPSWPGGESWKPEGWDLSFPEL